MEELAGVDGSGSVARGSGGYGLIVNGSGGSGSDGYGTTVDGTGGNAGGGTGPGPADAVGRGGVVPSLMPTWEATEARASVGADGVWDRAGVMRTVRRRMDVSQRGLAELVGVGHSTINALEDAEANVSLSVIQRVLAAAGLRLAVVDEVSGQEVLAEPPDVVRDRAGRRLPAHLDAMPAPFRDPRHCEWRQDRPVPMVTFARRYRGAALRARRGAVSWRHPTVAEVHEARRVRAFSWPPDPEEWLRQQPWLRRFYDPSWTPPTCDAGYLEYLEDPSFSDDDDGPERDVDG